MAVFSERDLSKSLYELWILAGKSLASDPGSARQTLTPMLTRLPKPGPAALRARYYVLKNLSHGSTPEWFEVPWPSWERQIELVPLGERALAEGDVGASEALFRELETMGRSPGGHPVVLVDALVGLGDVERTRDNTGAASDMYDEAERVARENGMDLGRLRALVPWLFLQRRGRSAEELMHVVDLCEELARGLDDAMYLANTYLVRAEILTANGDLAGAVEATDRAAELFGDHPVALPGLYVRLADAFRMAEDPDGLRRSVLKALETLRRVDQPTERAAALDLLATGRLLAGQWDSARVAAAASAAVAHQVGDGRGVAYANMTLSQIERKAHNLEAALDAREAATRYFDGREDSLGSLAYCLTEKSEVLEALGRRDDAAADVRGALTALESLRCVQSRPSAQQEYRRRFAQIYRRGLRMACRMRDPVLFVSVFEGLWGRRLVGLTTGAGPQLGDDAILRTHLLAQAKTADNSLAEADGSPTQRLLGRTALRSALPGMIEDGTGTAIASLSTPYDHALAKTHLDGVPPGTAALLLAPVPERPLRYFALLVDADGEACCDEYAMPEEVRSALNDWRSQPLLDHLDSLGPLTNLLPEQLDRLPEGTPLLIVPLEELWPLPWAAIPLGNGDVMGARFPLRICPSLALAAAMRERPTGWPRETRKWVGPNVQAQLLDGVSGERCESASAALAMLLDGQLGQDLIIVAHGVPLQALGHFLDLGEGLLLTPFEAMRAKPGGRVALISCWSAFVPEEQSGDPLTVATILQARGAASVLATSDELSDDPIGAHFVDSLLEAGQTMDWSHALRATILANIGFPEFRGRLRRWAPIRVLGAW